MAFVIKNLIFSSEGDAQVYGRGTWNIILDFLGNNVSSLIIGKSYSTKDLGYYNRANILPETIGLNAYNSINSVLLPTLASLQNDRDAMKRVTRKVMSLTEYIILPMMFGLIGVANVLIPSC